MSWIRTSLVMAIGLAAFALPVAAQATPPTPGAVIASGSVILGVTQYGDLNYNCLGAGDSNCPAVSAGSVNFPGTNVVGIRFAPLNTDATADGCACEGWGAADVSSGLTGYANESTGNGHIQVASFTHTASTAVSTVDITDSSLPGYSMRVVHDYHPSPVSPDLYEVSVSITNTGTSSIGNLRYRRNMDWDIEPTAYAEWVTVANTASSRQLLWDSDNGFVNSNPLSARSTMASGAVCGVGYLGTCEFTDLGSVSDSVYPPAGGVYPTVTKPYDHGAAFDFGFGSLAVGETRSFKTYYGAAPSESAALAAVDAQGIGVYSLGEPDCGNSDGSGAELTGLCAGLPAFAGVEHGLPNTFIFGFVTADADLSVVAPAPSTMTLGSDATTTFGVHNAGPDRALGVHLEIALPAGLVFKSASASSGVCSYVAPNVVCEIGSIASGANATVDLTTTSTALGPVQLVATETSPASDPDASNNDGTATITVGASAAAPAPAAGLPALPSSPVVTVKVSNTGIATLTFSGATGSTFRCALGAAPQTSCSSTMTLPRLASGSHSFSVEQIDAYGQTSAASTVTWVTRRATVVAPAGGPLLAVAPITVANAGRSVPAGCSLRVGRISRCEITLVATIAGRQVVVGRATRFDSGTRRLAVSIQLTGQGRVLAARASGLDVRVHSTIHATNEAVFHRSAPTRLVLQTLLVAGGDLLFDTDSAVVKPAALRFVAELRKTIPGAHTLRCVGFTDSRGTAAHNMTLGDERAHAVCALLASHTSARTSTSSMGAARPRAANGSIHGRALNRRVEVHVSY